jgi:hypothetical protein
MSGEEIKKGDIVEHLGTGQTFKVVSIAADKLKVKGNGTSMVLAVGSVKKAPDRPVREASRIAPR